MEAVALSDSQRSQQVGKDGCFKRRLNLIHAMKNRHDLPVRPVITAQYLTFFLLSVIPLVGRFLALSNSGSNSAEKRKFTSPPSLNQTVRAQNRALFLAT